MSNTINIPVQLRQLAGGREHIKVSKDDLVRTGHLPYLRGLIAYLEEIEAPGIKSRLLDQDGKLRRYVNVFVDGQDCRILRHEQAERETLGSRFYTQPENTDHTNPLDLRLTGYEEITILPAIAGG